MSEPGIWQEKDVRSRPVPSLFQFLRTHSSTTFSPALASTSSSATNPKSTGPCSRLRPFTLAHPWLSTWTVSTRSGSPSVTMSRQPRQVSGFHIILCLDRGTQVRLLLDKGQSVEYLIPGAVVSVRACAMRRCAVLIRRSSTSAKIAFTPTGGREAAKRREPRPHTRAARQRLQTARCHWPPHQRRSLHPSVPMPARRDRHGRPTSFRPAG
jgi:hypothetical protein